MSGLQQWKWRGPYEQLSLWDDCSSEPLVASSVPESPTGEVQLLEKILERDNLRRALRQVRRNKGAPGVDGITVRQLGRHLTHHSLDLYRLISRTAVYGPVRTVVWEGGRREVSSLSRLEVIFLLSIERLNWPPVV